MMAQPLAWFEGTGLPEEAFAIAPLLAVWREHAGAFHSGVTLPVGDEPDGGGWTGFQSVVDSSTGYLLVFRERTAEADSDLVTWLAPGQEVRLTCLAGDGEDGVATVGRRGTVAVSLPQPFSFALFRYEIES
jgi:hypothetical protein